MGLKIFIFIILALAVALDFAIIRPVSRGSVFHNIGDVVMCQNFDGQRICGKVTP